MNWLDVWYSRPGYTVSRRQRALDDVAASHFGMQNGTAAVELDEVLP